MRITAGDETWEAVVNYWLYFVHKFSSRSHRSFVWVFLFHKYVKM